MKRSRYFLILGATTAVLACTDGPTSPRQVAAPNLDLQATNAAAWFARWVAVGTSVSQGWASEGVHVGTQELSWPAQLGRRVDVEITQPYIARPGCRSPFASPLISFTRESGESIIPSPGLSCAPNLPGVVLPTQNVAISGARATHILGATPENMPPTDANAKLYARVLPPNTTQLQAMLRQRPLFVSVEVGGNEVLGARGGLVRIPQDVEDPAVFAMQFDRILAWVRDARPQGAVLVGLPRDFSNVPGFRTGNELWADRLALLGGFHVDVNPNCNGNPNLVTVPTIVVGTIGAGLQSKQGGGLPVPLSCADIPNVPDGILTPADVQKLKEVLGRMSSHIRKRAQENGWAYFDLGALYANPAIRPPFSSVALMMTAEPYGRFISRDGFHPTGLGQTLLANAAAVALNARYGLGLSATGAPW